MEKGQFYASTGVTFDDVNFANNVLSVAVKAEKGIDYDITFIGCDLDDKETRVLSQVKGTSAKLEVTDKMKFVRVKVVSTKLHNNPIENAIYEMAWTQPVVYTE